eukprot:4868593-Amphidinium_carterae.1
MSQLLGALLQDVGPKINLGKCEGIPCDGSASREMDAFQVLCKTEGARCGTAVNGNYPNAIEAGSAPFQILRQLFIADAPYAHCSLGTGPVQLGTRRVGVTECG